MQRKLLIALFAAFLLAAKACAARAEGPILEHKPPVQIYQGVPFKLVVRPLVPLKGVVLRIDLAGAELKVPMRRADKLFYLDVQGKSTKGRRGPVTYSFVAVDAAGRSIEVNDPSGKRFQTRLLPPPLAALVYPVGGKATGDALAVIIGFNEAFAIVPADSFRITFDGQGALGVTAAPGQISFPVGPGLRNGTHTVRFETAAIPGWKDFKRSWTFSLQKSSESPVDKGGPLTVNAQTSGDPAALGAPQLGQPANLSLSWDGKFLGLDGGFITPTLSSLTLSDPTPLTFTDSSLFGVQARLDLGPLGGRLILGQSVAGGDSAYPQMAIAAGVALGSFSLNFTAVFDDQNYAPLGIIARQSYVTSLGYIYGSDEPGQRGGTVEIASALSFPNAQATADWTIIQAQAASPGASQGLKLLAMLQPLLQTFPIPDTSLSPPDLGLGYRVTAWAPIGRATGRLELSHLGQEFLSLGSASYPGTTAVLMIAFDPERPATKPFTYDPGPVYESPEGAEGTYGLHLTGVGFDLFGDPARVGLDFFNTDWQGGTTAQTIRLLFGYYTYLDLDLAMESCYYSAEGHGHYYGIEGTGTRRIGRITLAASAGAHVLQEYQPDPAYGFGLKLKYDGNLGDLGLVVVLDLTYGDPFEFQSESPEVAWSLGASVNF